MLASLALIFLLGLAMAALCKGLGLPRIIGMLLTGILLGPHVLNLLDGSILGISADLRKLALVIILLKAGLSLELDDLKKVGRPALLLSFLPALCELTAFTLLAPALLGVSPLTGAVIGAILAAVSPAVVVPKMVQLMETGYGTNKQIPQLILAGASLDDVFVIVVFSALLGMAQGGGLSPGAFAAIPISIVLGLAAGATVGSGLNKLFEGSHARGRTIRNSVKVIVLLGCAFSLVSIEDLLSSAVPFSGLLAVMGMGVTLRRCSPAPVAARLGEKLGKLWLCAEVLLFVLVGAAVDLRYTLQAGPAAVLAILLALAVRSVGTALALTGTRLDRKERLFCVIAYLPKATVQAAIGSVPLALGLPFGDLALSMAVLAILITAPLGALGMEAAYQRFLTHTPADH